MASSHSNEVFPQEERLPEEQLPKGQPPKERETTGENSLPKKDRRFGIFFWISVLWLGVVVFCAIFADWLPLQDRDEMDFMELQALPSESHLLGTDLTGRDILSRVIYGARVSLAVGVGSPAIGVFFGLFIGLLAGYYRGRFETVMLAAIDTVLALPGLVVLLLSAAVFGQNLLIITLSLGFLLIPPCARISRANTLNFAQREFIVAAKALGAKDGRIILLELLPNVVLPVVTYALVLVAFAIVVEGALSFLGLSVPSPTPSWGGMIAEGREHLAETPHVSFIPATVMFLTVLSFNWMGDILRSKVADVRSSAI